MDVLGPVLAWLAMGGAVLFWFRCQAERDACSEHEQHITRELRKVIEAQSRITAAEREIETLRLELRKVAGRIYASTPRAPEPEPQPETAEQVRARLRVEHALPKVGKQ